jgi:hypothetical protein
MTAKINEKPGCLSIFLPFLGRSKKKPAAEALPYRLRDDFLSPAEFSFYKVLASLVGTRLTVQSKVRLADIFFVARPNEKIAFFNRIAQRHLDFLVCEAKTMKPLFGIELDDSSHQRSDRQERDEFVEQVFQAARLPLLRVSVQREYDPREIAAKIAPLIKDKVGVPAAPPPQPAIHEQVGTVPPCPKCGIPMVLRTVAQGEHKGKQFYGCQNYPRCREMKPFIT